MAEDQQDKPAFLYRYRFLVAIFVCGAIALFVMVVKAFNSQLHKPSKVQQIEMVKLNPLPPPPPPPPPPKVPEQKPMEQKMVEQQHMDDPEPKPDDKPAPEPAPSALGTTIKGDGSSDAFGLAAGGGGGFFGGPTTQHKQGSKYGWYAGKVKTSITLALRKNKVLRTAAFRVEIRVWSDPLGRITRATLKSSSGDPSVDEALTKELLVGLQLPEAPPEDMPMPIVLSISAKRPN